MKNKIRIKINRMYEAVASVDALYEKYAVLNNIGYLDMLMFYEMLEDSEPFTQKRMCDTLEISKTTMNSVIKRWIAKDYIQLLVNSTNGREKLIILTKDGEKYAHTLIDPLFEMEKKAIQPISEDELKVVETIVSKYSDSLSEQINNLEEKVK